MFKLAELLWEEARRLYLIKMDDFSRALEKCSQKKGECEQPKEPRIDLKEAEALYKRAPRQVPEVPPHGSRHVPDRLRREGGPARGRGDGAVPGGDRRGSRSRRCYGDSWMMVGEHYFATASGRRRKDAYTHIPDNAAT